MPKITILHILVSLLILDLSVAFTSRLLENRANDDQLKNNQQEEHYEPEKHHTVKRHTIRRHNFNNEGQLDDPNKPPSRRHVHSRQTQLQQADEEAIDQIFNMEQQTPEQPLRHLNKRQSSNPALYQSNTAPGSFINNHFHQYPYQNYQQMPVAQYSNQIPYYPYNFGVAPIIICLCCNNQQQPQTPQTPQTNPQMPQNNITGIFTRIDPENEINYDTQYYNTATGITLDIIPPRRNLTRPPPPISHGASSGSGSSEPATTRIPIPQTQRPIPQAQRPAMTTRRPQVLPPQSLPQQPQQPQQPSNGGYPNSDNGNTRDRNPRMCAFAVLQCCNNNRYDLRCFQSRGCPGPFFDNPCDNELARAVVSYVNTFTFSP